MNSYHRWDHRINVIIEVTDENYLAQLYFVAEERNSTFSFMKHFFKMIVKSNNNEKKNRKDAREDS